ncbi:MAG: MBL fold metallo-hydrolase, partial [Alphaproteobacteria bacterium]
MNQWQIGKVRITRVVEVEMAGGTRFILPQATPDAVRPLDWMVPHFATEAGKLIMSIHALIIDTGSRRIIVDTCLGNDKKREIPAWNMLQTTFLADLEAAGYPRDSIDTVLCTHLHVDHVGWNTMLQNGKWVPTFPNARYLLGDIEWQHWQKTEQAEFGDVIADSVAPVVEAGLADFVAMDHRICEEVSLFPSPGHTPGHVCV